MSTQTTFETPTAGSHAAIFDDRNLVIVPANASGGPTVRLAPDAGSDQRQGITENPDVKGKEPVTWADTEGQAIPHG